MIARLVCWWRGHRDADLPRWRMFDHIARRWTSIDRRVCLRCNRLDAWEAQ